MDSEKNDAFSLTGQHEEICAGFTEAALLDAMDFILRDQLENKSGEIAAAVQGRMIRELQTLDYSKLRARYPC
jgi:hypothetical protein